MDHVPLPVENSSEKGVLKGVNRWVSLVDELPPKISQESKPIYFSVPKPPIGHLGFGNEPWIRFPRKPPWTNQKGPPDSIHDDVNPGLINPWWINGVSNSF